MSKLKLSIENVGGIESLEQEFDDGVTLITGPNASNKTSLLHAVAFALGRSDVPIRSGTTEAYVTLTVNGDQVTRTASRTEDGLSISGEPLLTGTGSANALSKFTSLLEFNELRAAVRNGNPFIDLLKEPLNLTELETKRTEKLREKRRLTQQIDALDGSKGKLYTVSEELSNERKRRKKLHEELETLRAKRDESHEENEELGELRDERADLVAERDRQQRRIENTTTAIDDLESQHGETRSKLAETRETVERYDKESVQMELTRLENQLAERRERISVLQSVLSANREMLHGGYTGALGQELSLSGDSYLCWTCGQSVDESQFEEALETLTDVIEKDKNAITTHEPEIDEYTDRLEEIENASQRVSELETRFYDIEAKLEQRRDSLATQRERLEELEVDIRAIESEIDELREEESDAESSLDDEIESKRVEIERVRSSIDRLSKQKLELQERIDRKKDFEDELEELSGEITDLTERIETAEDDLRESFNETMAELVDSLDFRGIQRIWLDGEFDLVIARSIDGTTQRERVSHLAESERELIGFVLGLAGYLNYDVGEDSPLVTLDSIRAFDSERAEKLIEYFSDCTDFVLVAVHPDRANDLPFSAIEVGSWESVDV